MNILTIPGLTLLLLFYRGPYRVMSYEAVARLRERGFKVRPLVDGYQEWRLAGLPVSAGLPKGRGGKAVSRGRSK